AGGGGAEVDAGVPQVAPGGAEPARGDEVGDRRQEREGDGQQVTVHVGGAEHAASLCASPGGTRPGNPACEEGLHHAVCRRRLLRRGERRGTSPAWPRSCAGEETPARARARWWSGCSSPA